MRKSSKHCPKAIPEGFSAVLYSNYDDTILLKEADEAFIRLYGCRKSDLGQNICNVFGKEEYEKLKYYSDTCRGQICTMRYIKKFKDIPDTLWSITVEMHYPVMNCSGRLIFDERCRLNPKNYRVFFGSAVCSHTNGNFRAEICSDGNHSLFGKLLSMLSVQMIMQRCLVTCRDESLSETIYLPDRGLRPVEITAAPFPHHEKEYVILTLRETELPGTLYSGNEPSVLLERELIGCGIVNCTRGRYRFDDLNPLLARLVSKNVICISDITESCPFRTAMLEGLSGFGIIERKNRGQDYILSVVPVEDSLGTVSAAVFIIPIDKRDMIDSGMLKMLSARECNVLRLAVSGLSTKEICNALNISDGTAKKELCAGYKKLGVSNRIEAMKKLYHI